jgi:hypothetical protein
MTGRFDDLPRTWLVQALMQEMVGTATQKLDLLEKLKAAGMLQREDGLEVQRAEDLLRKAEQLQNGSNGTRN